MIGQFKLVGILLSIMYQGLSHLHIYLVKSADIILKNPDCSSLSNVYFRGYNYQILNCLKSDQSCLHLGCFSTISHSTSICTLKCAKCHWLAALELKEWFCRSCTTTLWSLPCSPHPPLMGIHWCVPTFYNRLSILILSSVTLS